MTFKSGGTSRLRGLFLEQNFLTPLRNDLTLT